jgi:dipeptidyl aminopeptidase/acylaminoacyl peptidase
MSKFVERGYNVLMYDARAHGESEGLYCTYGFYEKEDLLSSILYLEKSGFIETQTIIGLMGTSLGGAIALQAAEKEQRIRFCITEAAFSHFPSTLEDYRSKGFFVLSKPFNKIIDKRIEKIGKFNIKDISPRDSISKFEGRTLLVHGRNDKKIYIKYQQQLFENALYAELMTLDSDHNDIREAGGVDYLKILINFADTCIADMEK